MNTKLRVLHVLGELRPSGAEMMFCNAAQYFIKNNVESEIVATGKQLGSFAPQLAGAGYKLHHIVFSKSPFFFLKLYKLMRSGNYDVYHLHTERASFWIGLIALAQKSGVVLKTIHSNFDFKGNLRLRRMIQRRILKRLGVFHVSISPSVQETEFKHFGLETYLIPNWYDSNRYYQNSEYERRKAKIKLGINSYKKVIVTVGNCSIIKNHSSLIEALALMPSEARPYYLHVGIEEEGQPERKLAERLGVINNISFLGPLSDVRTILNAADIFVMPSLVEGFGVAAVEALATGLPVIFTDVAGLRDFRLNFEGLSYTGTDAVSMKNTLHTLVNESSEQLSLRAKNYSEICKAMFGIEQGVESYLQLYRK